MRTARILASLVLLGGLIAGPSAAAVSAAAPTCTTRTLNITYQAQVTSIGIQNGLSTSTGHLHEHVKYCFNGTRAYAGSPSPTRPGG